jgi:hypothetical protein
LPFVAIWFGCGDLCGSKGVGRHQKMELYRVATSKKVYGGFLVHRRRVTRASPCVRRYIHILAMRNAEWVCDPFACE